ncbi:signal recognition particle-docking protein FtsY [Candidatus Woesearchaeota archaeon]|nr:signal recognition particle-docking protein FtsY [Candidatus Woesearchaeota archaeon]
MFKFLKDKLKKAVSSISKKAEEEAEVVEEPAEEPKAEKKTEPKKEKKPAKAEKAKPKKEPKPARKEEKRKEAEKKPEAKPEKPEKEEKKEELPEKKKKAEKVPEPAEPEEKKELAEAEKEQETKEEKKAHAEPEKKEAEKETPAAERAEQSEEPQKKGFFGKLKDRFSHKEAEPEEKEEEKEEEDKKEKPAPEKAKAPEEKKKEAEKKAEPAEEKKAEVKEEPEEEEKEKEETEETPEAEEPEKKGFFSRIRDAVSTKVLTEKQFEEMFFELEIALLENNVAMEVVDKIKQDMKDNLVDKRIERGKFEEKIALTLHDSIESLFDIERIDIDKAVKEKNEPYKIVFVGVNGSGKTTTIAKTARLMQQKGLKPVIAAADTFRAAAIQQLEEHGKNLSVKVIKHDYGSDPAAVAFDAIKYAKSKELDIVLIDTAGRQHSNVNLMDEMKKIIRVADPDLKIFVGESITGNDCIEQARNFNEAVGIDGIVLTKADVDEKGGAAVSVSYVTGKPIIFIGTGQDYEDLKEFDKSIIMENIGLA